MRNFCELIINEILVIEDRGITGRVLGETEITPPTWRIRSRELEQRLKDLVKGKGDDYFRPSPLHGRLNFNEDGHCIMIQKPLYVLRREAMERHSKHLFFLLLDWKLRAG